MVRHRGSSAELVLQTRGGPWTSGTGNEQYATGLQDGQRWRDLEKLSFFADKRNVFLQLLVHGFRRFKTKGGSTMNENLSPCTTREHQISLLVSPSPNRHNRGCP